MTHGDDAVESYATHAALAAALRYCLTYHLVLDKLKLLCSVSICISSTGLTACEVHVSNAPRQSVPAHPCVEEARRDRGASGGGARFLRSRNTRPHACPCASWGKERRVITLSGGCSPLVSSCAHSSLTVWGGAAAGAAAPLAPTRGLRGPGLRLGVWHWLPRWVRFRRCGPAPSPSRGPPPSHSFWAGSVAFARAGSDRLGLFCFVACVSVCVCVCVRVCVCVCVCSASRGPSPCHPQIAYRSSSSLGTPAEIPGRFAAPRPHSRGRAPSVLRV